MPKISDSCLTEGTLLSDKAGPVDFHGAKAMVGWRWIRCGGMKWSWCRDAMRWPWCRAAADDMTAEKRIFQTVPGELGSFIHFSFRADAATRWTSCSTAPSQSSLKIGAPRTQRGRGHDPGIVFRAPYRSVSKSMHPYLAPGCRSLGRHFPRSSGKDR
jgi:hypothetical protein